jgi:hypothetical protein
MGRRFERTLLVLVVCVPVPALALSGLAIPLPGVVERIGAALVPWANAAVLDTQSLAASTTRGTIVLTPGQRTRATVEVDTTDATGRQSVRPARPRMARPLLARTSGTTTPVEEETSEPATPETVPTAPVDPHGDGDVPESPAPAPAPGAGEPSNDTDGNLPVEPGPTPNADPVPDREPKEEPDVKPQPADEDDAPPDGVDPTPPLEIPVDVPKPDLKPVVDLVDSLLDPLGSGDDANASDRGR